MNSTTMNRPEPDDFRADERLWHLLGEGRPVSVSPYFARRVRRSVLEAPKTPGWLAGWRIALPAVACVTLAFLSALAVIPRTSPEELTAGTPEQEFETIADLDLLIASNDSTLWLDSSSSR